MDVLARPDGVEGGEIPRDERAQPQPAGLDRQGKLDHPRSLCLLVAVAMAPAAGVVEPVQHPPPGTMLPPKQKPIAVRSSASAAIELLHGGLMGRVLDSGERPPDPEPSCQMSG